MQAGTLVVKLLYAHNLKDKDWFGKQDPYAKLIIGNQVFRSKVHKGGGANPVWNQQFRFQVINDNTLCIELWDEDLISDDLIGRATVDLANVRTNGSTHQEAQVCRKSGKISGAVVVDLEFQPQCGVSPYQQQMQPPAAMPMPSPPSQTSQSYSGYPPNAMTSPPPIPEPYKPSAAPAPAVGYPSTAYNAPPTASGGSYGTAQPSSMSYGGPPQPNSASFGPPPAGYPPAGNAPAGYPPAGYPPAGYPPAGYPPSGYPASGAYAGAGGYPSASYGYAASPYPGGYGAAPPVVVQQPQRNSGMGFGGMALAGAGGLLGGLMLGEVMDDIF